MAAASEFSSAPKAFRSSVKGFFVFLSLKTNKSKNIEYIRSSWYYKGSTLLDHCNHKFHHDIFLISYYFTDNVLKTFHRYQKKYVKSFQFSLSFKKSIDTFTSFPFFHKILDQCLQDFSLILAYNISLHVNHQICEEQEPKVTQVYWDFYISIFLPIKVILDRFIKFLDMTWFLKKIGFSVSQSVDQASPTYLVHWWLLFLPFDDEC